MIEYSSKEDVHNRAKDAVGLSMQEIYESNSRYDANPKNKNYVGDAFELWMGVEKNSRSEADIADLGVELKATPYKFVKSRRKSDNKQLVSAKERLVLNIINYMDEAKATFDTSSFSHKDKLMELIFYNHNTEKPKTEWTFDEAILFSFPEKDLEIIKHDWEIIHKAILDGKAHELSEGMTDYLGACTKGASKKTVREQPFSKIKAKQRAYSLKAAYMTSLLRNYVFGDKHDPAIRKERYETQSEKDTNPIETEEIATANELKNESLDNIILRKINSFKGKSVADLKKEFGIKKTSSSKQLNSIIIARMLGLKGNSANSAEEVQKAGIKIKTISLNPNNSVKEHMSFPKFKFKELINQSFEDSVFYDELSRRFLFAVFKNLKKDKPKDEEIIFIGAKFWHLPNKDLPIIESVFNDTIATAKNGVHLRVTKNRVYNNFISAKEERIAHVRPHEQKSQYVKGDYSDELPTPAIWENRPDDNDKYDPSGLYMTRQSFWLNSDYIGKQITDILSEID